MPLFYRSTPEVAPARPASLADKSVAADAQFAAAASVLPGVLADMEEAAALKREVAEASRERARTYAMRADEAEESADEYDDVALLVHRLVAQSL